MNAHKPFSLCGYSFQNELGIQRDGSSFGPGSSNRGGERPVGRGFQRRRRCLGRKNPMKPEVSWHTILLARSSVLYLWRPWVAERGCSGREQALSVSHRTGGFCVLPDEKPRSLREQNPPVRVYVMRRSGENFGRNSWSAAASPGEPKGYQARRSDATPARYSSNEITVSFGSFSF